MVVPSQRNFRFRLAALSGHQRIQARRLKKLLESGAGRAKVRDVVLILRSGSVRQLALGVCREAGMGGHSGRQ